MSLGFTPPPVTENLQFWAQNVVAYLRRTASRLQFKSTTSPATEDGVILWDAANGYPVVSKNNMWRQVVLADGQYMGGITTDQVATVVNTPYTLTYTVIVADNGIAADPTHPSRIVFAEGGEYLISFSAQLSSGSSSDVSFYFWPRVNGVNYPGSTMINTIKNNGAQVVTSRTAIFDFVAGDYIEAIWAVTNLNGYLHAIPATSFCPAAPASTISITRIRA